MPKSSGRIMLVAKNIRTDVEIMLAGKGPSPRQIWLLQATQAAWNGQKNECLQALERAKGLELHAATAAGVETLNQWATS